MSNAMYTASVPVFTQMLGSLDALLATAAAHVAERKIEPVAILNARLFPDMFPFTRQVQIACDFARGVCARLAGVDVPVFPDDRDAGFDALRELVAASSGFIKSIDTEAFNDSTDRDIVLRPGTPKERHLKGGNYLLNYGLPQFFFHVTTAYALLRHNGVEVGKRDFMGQY